MTKEVYETTKEILNKRLDETNEKIKQARATIALVNIKVATLKIDGEIENKQKQLDNMRMRRVKVKAFKIDVEHNKMLSEKQSKAIDHKDEKQEAKLISDIENLKQNKKTKIKEHNEAVRLVRDLLFKVSAIKKGLKKLEKTYQESQESGKEAK